MQTLTLPTQAVNPMLASITPVILTYNEADNISRTLKRLTWANRIVVVDSFSTDETLDILDNYPQVALYQRPFDTHANQWNYGLSLVETPWVLSLDADYGLSDELTDELTTLDPESEVDCYRIPFQYCVFGKPLRETFCRQERPYSGGIKPPTLTMVIPSCCSVGARLLPSKAPFCTMIASL